MRTLGKMMVVLALGAGMTACTNSEQASTQPPGDTTAARPATKTATSAATTPATGTATATTPAGPPCKAEDVKVEGAAGSKPKITIPTTCAPPAELLTKDLVPGSGAEVKAGSNVEVQYVLVTWSDQEQKDASWDRGEPYALQNVGQAQVIDGWNEGLIGIKQGARRLLVVPADKGYGPQGRSGIAPNETLVFVVDAVTVS